MSIWEAYLEDVRHSFRKQKEWAEQAASQLDDNAFFRQPAEHSNSVAIIVKHVGGNLKSRWTDLLTTDGDKSWRNRDGEFVIGSEDTRAHLFAAWEEGWAAVFQALDGLREDDLLKRITIRGEEHTVLQAIDRSLAHVAYHTGQVLYVARLVKGNGWRWITIPPGQSEQFKAAGRKYLK
jgi:uncharacterized damage-inducible protein DinB